MQATRRTVLAGAGALAACQPKARPEDMLRVGLPTGADSLDPFKGEFAAAAILYHQIHAPLTGYREPHGLARSWESEAGNTRWRARLRDGLEWSDGEPLTAEDVLWSLRYGADPATGWPGVGDLEPIQGAAEALYEGGPVEALGARVVNARTLEFDLRHPLADFPDAMREFYPVNPRVVETFGPDWTRPENFVGAGAYLPITESQLAARLRKNPRHHRAADVAIPVIDMQVVDDAGARVRLFRAGDLDLGLNPPTGRLSELEETLGGRLRTYPAPRLTYLKVNHNREALAKDGVRRALHLAIDRQFIAEQILGGFAEPAFTAVPGTPERLSVTAHDQRLAAAQRMLEREGYGPDNPLSLELMHYGGEQARIAVSLADDWQRIGVDVTIAGTEPTGLFAAVDEGRFDIAIARFDRGLKDEPWRYLEPFEPGGYAANFGWEDPEISQRIMEIRAATDPETRQAAILAAERVLMGDAHLIPVVREDAAWMIAGRVIQSHPGTQPLFWADLALKQP